MGRRHRLAEAALAWACVLAACGGDTAKPEQAVFPANFRDTYQEARDCRPSHDHDLRYVRVFASPDAYDTYKQQEGTYDPGAILVKEEYDDRACANLVEYTALLKLAPGTDPPNDDWKWQRTTLDRRPIDREGEVPDRCIECHRWHCGAPPYGLDLTCSDFRYLPEPPAPDAGPSP